ncbi:hypothetical protein JOF53_004640 [Crossiella equi]|uniref:Uncharacterized protein n=1 Tax=Crossiella equi TaxID=130796 RepID=A0ABS5AGQ2_9PSEU|nr:hypothetical protein [Crossiella equi]MBP2475768.1 hypothetical protein [Crossiella equi]
MRATLRRLGATALVTAVAGFGLAVPANAAPALTLSADELAVAEQGIRHTFSKEETQFLFDAARTGGETLVSLGCTALVPPPANAVCGPVAKFLVTLVSSPFNPNGRCAQVYADLNEFPPIGAKYVTC